MKSKKFKKVYVYDLMLRLLHALLAVATMTLIITGIYGVRYEPGAAKSAIWSLHIASAKVLTGTILVRIIWAFVGYRWALWSEFWHWSTWRHYLKIKIRRFDESKLGHDPYASLVYLLFYLTTFFMLASGWMLAGIIHARGPLAESIFDNISEQYIAEVIHEVGFWLTSAFVVIHIVGLVLFEKRHSIPVSQSMVSGYKYTSVEEEDT